MALCQSVRLYLHLHPCLVHWEDTLLLSWVTLYLIVLLFVDITSLGRVQITLNSMSNISRYVLQKTGLASFLQTSHIAENALFSEENKDGVVWSQTVSLKNRVSREKSPEQQWNVGISKIVRTYKHYNLKIQQRRWSRPELVWYRDGDGDNPWNKQRPWNKFPAKDLNSLQWLLLLAKCEKTRHGRR